MAAHSCSGLATAITTTSSSGVEGSSPRATRPVARPTRWPATVTSATTGRPIAGPLASLRLADHLLHRVEERLQAERPAELGVDPYQDQLLGLALAGHEHEDLEIGQMGVLADLPKDVPPVLVRQLRVQDQQVVGLFLQPRQPIGPTGRLVHLVPGELQPEHRLPQMLRTVIDE